MSNVYIGIDVCKDFLDVYIHPLETHRRFINRKQGYKEIKKWLDPHTVTQVIVESTGKLHRDISRYLHQNGYNIAILNPYRSRKFADSLGILAKTDKVDAKVLSLFGAYLQPENSVIATLEQEEFQDILSSRAQIVAHISQIKNIITTHQTEFVVEMFKQQLAFLKHQLKCLESKLEESVMANDEMSNTYKILLSIKGVGKINALLMIAYLPELGKINNKKIASLAGLAPFNYDSGTMRGKRMIKGGRAPVRAGLYMASISASLHNHDLKIFYNRLIENGKKPKVALTAVARKILILANTLVSQNRKYAEHFA